MARRKSVSYPGFSRQNRLPMPAASPDEEWVEMFPGAESRPARHTLQSSADSLDHVTCGFTAAIGG